MFVATVLTDNAVAKVTALAITTMPTAPANPTFPTTHPALKNRITPRIVRIDGVNTPMKVPNFLVGDGLRRNARVMAVRRFTILSRIGLLDVRKR
jgi:hypothetical protein